jgi:predicted enzyme related to lactoylglutathione lyase
MSNAINWFEIPAVDLDRAAHFWEKVLGVQLKRETFGGRPHAVFTAGGHDAVGGAIVRDEHRKPSPQGVCVYLATKDVDGALARVPAAGGKVAVPKTDIGENGVFAIVVDTEGNAVGIHAERA